MLKIIIKVGSANFMTIKKAFMTFTSFKIYSKSIFAFENKPNNHR